MNEILKALKQNGVQRNLSIMGGEPLAEENLFLTAMVITEVRKHYPDIIISLWTGYTYEKLLTRGNSQLQYILNNIDILVDGPFILAERDITLPMRGSRNQKIRYLKEKTES